MGWGLGVGFLWRPAFLAQSHGISEDPLGEPQLPWLWILALCLPQVFLTWHGAPAGRVARAFCPQH